MTKVAGNQSSMLAQNCGPNFGNGLGKDWGRDLDRVHDANEATSNQIVGEIRSTGLLAEGRQLFKLLDDAKFRRILINPDTGGLLDFGRQTYRPPKSLRPYVKMRDKTCRAPGCVRNARYCDLDHIKSWDSGGNTRKDNLASLCRTHHLLKTHGDWQYEITPEGKARWTLPGQVYVERPAHRLVDDDAAQPF